MNGCCAPRGRLRDLACRTTANRMAAHAKLDRRRDDLWAGVDKRLPFLVSSVVCVRSWLGCIARLENRFMDRVPGCHGDIMSAQRLPMRPRSLLLHWLVFHSRCCCFPWIRSWIFAVWTVRMDVDLRRNSYWRYRPNLHSGTHSRSPSTKSTRRGLTNR